MNHCICRSAALRILLGCLLAANTATADGTRARDLGIPFAGQPGELNAITDVAGVEVGQVTLIEGQGSLVDPIFGGRRADGQETGADPFQ